MTSNDLVPYDTVSEIPSHMKTYKQSQELGKIVYKTDCQKGLQIIFLMIYRFTICYSVNDCDASYIESNIEDL